MLEWGTTGHETTAEDEAAFRERVGTEHDFTATYADADALEVGAADVYSHGGFVHISRADDPEADGEHDVVLSCTQMNRLARDWLRFRGRWPWMEDE